MRDNADWKMKFETNTTKMINDIKRNYHVIEK